jgi:hypothetical protein
MFFKTSESKPTDSGFTVFMFILLDKVKDDTKFLMKTMQASAIKFYPYKKKIIIVSSIEN